MYKWQPIRVWRQGKAMWTNHRGMVWIVKRNRLLPRNDNRVQRRSLVLGIELCIWTLQFLLLSCGLQLQRALSTPDEAYHDTVAYGVNHPDQHCFTVPCLSIETGRSIRLHSVFRGRYLPLSEIHTDYRNCNYFLRQFFVNNDALPRYDALNWPNLDGEIPLWPERKSSQMVLWHLHCP